MTHTILIAGYGGQGILFLGQFFAYLGMFNDMHVTWVPSYGPEMRGGSANCSVVISSEDIKFPIVTNPETVILMNEPSYKRFKDKFSPRYKIVNTSLVNLGSDNNVLGVPASKIAEDLGNVRVANMVMAGCYIELTKDFDTSRVEEILRNLLKERAHLLDINLKAFEAGRRYIGGKEWKEL
ncbi:MAG: 2-oxoacid:acceptor oxidoreductase family protein [bacterium]|nr:2-oxoacid:acceptor oxidoreductase family protein [bacterium]